MSTFDAQNIESTSGGAPDFSQGLNVGGSDITTLITMTEYYSQASAPSTPANGAVWWDGSVAYQYVGGAWRILSLSPPPTWYGDRGLFAGGNTGSRVNTIQYISIPTTGNATDFGDLLNSVDSVGGVSDGGRGVFAGGYIATNIIQYVAIATTGNATDFGDLTLARQVRDGRCSDGVYGLFAGSSTSNNIVDYITIATTGNATDFGDMLGARSAPAGCSDGTKGVIAGGFPGATGYGDDVIQYFIVATPGNAVDFGDLTQARYGLGGASNKTRGVFGGGTDGSFTDTIDYITIATPGNAIDFGDLTLARRYVTASANGIRAVFGGGQGTPVVTRASTIDYVTIDTPGNATDFGDLLAGMIAAGSCSGD